MPAERFLIGIATGLVAEFGGAASENVGTSKKGKGNSGERFQYRNIACIRRLDPLISPGLIVSK